MAAADAAWATFEAFLADSGIAFDDVRSADDAARASLVAEVPDLQPLGRTLVSSRWAKLAKAEAGPTPPAVPPSPLRPASDAPPTPPQHRDPGPPPPSDMVDTPPRSPAPSLGAVSGPVSAPPPAAVPMDLGLAADPSRLRQRVARYYEAHGLDVTNVDEVVRRYGGDEVALFARLVERYGPEPTAGDPADLGLPLAPAVPATPGGAAAAPLAAGLAGFGPMLQSQVFPPPGSAGPVSPTVRDDRPSFAAAPRPRAPISSQLPLLVDPSAAADIPAVRAALASGNPTEALPLMSALFVRDPTSACALLHEFLPQHTTGTIRQYLGVAPDGALGAPASAQTAPERPAQSFAAATAQGPPGTDPRGGQATLNGRPVPTGAVLTAPMLAAEVGGPCGVTRNGAPLLLPHSVQRGDTIVAVPLGPA